MLKSLVTETLSPLKGHTRTLGLLHFVDALGTGVFWSGSVVYFTRVSGVATSAIAVGFSLAGVAGVVSSLTFGLLADRFGARRTLSIILGLLAASYLLYPLVSGPVSLVVLMAIIGGLEFGCGPSFGSLIATHVPDGTRVAARASLRSLFNLGVTVGALLVVILISIGTTLSLTFIPLIDAITFGIAAALVLRLPKDLAHPPTAEKERLFKAVRDAPFVLVVVAVSLLAFQEAAIAVGLPVWVVSRTALPDALIPFFVILNTACVVLFQVVASRGAETIKGASRVLRWAGLVSLAGCVVLFVGSWGPVWLAIAVCFVGVGLFTLAELWHSAGAFGLSFALAPKNAQAEYLGTFQLYVVGQAALGPIVITSLVTRLDQTGWLLVGAIFVVGILLLAPAVRWAERGVHVRPHVSVPVRPDV